VVRGSTGVLAVCRAVEERARRYAPECLLARIEDFSLLAPVPSPASPTSSISPMPRTSPGAEASSLHPQPSAPSASSAPPAPQANIERLADLPGPPGPIVLYVGNLQPYQGIDLLLAGFVHARAQVPEARLVVIGGPERIDHYRAQAAALGLDGAVHFLGPRPLERLGDYLRQATVLASPRVLGKNTPMKIYSYLDSGRPLVATRLPTHPQVLDDEVACLTAPDPVAFGEGLALLLASEPLRERIGAAARRYARREFTPEAFAAKLLGFYGEVERRLGHCTGRDAHRNIGPDLEPDTGEPPRHGVESRPRHRAL
jgi:glycosyltransferase involved in cell wall biosynthesis